MTLTKTRVAPVALILAALAALFLWRWHEHPTLANKVDRKTAISTSGSATSASLERPDPKTQPRGSIEGSITDEKHAAVPHARVCAEIYTSQISTQEIREPYCTTADDNGHYLFRELYAAEYSVAASAKPFLPAMYHPEGDRKQMTFELKAGERRTGVDIVLREGAIEISGVVNDVSGGPIAHALVQASQNSWDTTFSTPVETDDQGAFTMWVRPGSIHLRAHAEGYGPGQDDGQAPGSRFQILLTPESSLAGTVVDARTGEPVPGVEVAVAAADAPVESTADINDITDEHGAFRISRLEPGRYTVDARSAHGFGVSAGTTLVGLGQHVENVVVKLHAASRISGTVVLPDKKTRCKIGSVSIHELKKDRWYFAIREPDGMLHMDGVLPGTYNVDVSCDGYQSRDSYDKLVVADKDLENLVWQVGEGAQIRGRVVTKAGAPVEGATIAARTIGGAARDKTAWASDTSAPDGSYSLTGLKPGTFSIEIRSDVGIGPNDGWKVEVAPGAVIDKELVIDDGGTVKGLVIDERGKPVAGVHVRAQSSKLNWYWAPSSVRTLADGSFTIEHLRAGDYQVIPLRFDWTEELRKPGTTDDAKQGEKVTVANAKTSNVKLVVEAQSGVIKGTVTDTAGTPVSDAFVVAARESNASGARTSNVEMTRWWAEDRPVLSNTDGTFTISQLSAGNYTIRVYRKGGGEAIAEHVPIGTTAKLVIKTPGTIAGVVRREGMAIEEMRIDLRDEKTGYERSETFFRTGGTFEMRDLPAGHFTLIASTDNGKRQIDIDLAEGETKQGLDIMLEELVTLTGRVIDLRTNKPVPGIRMSAALEKAQAGFDLDGDDPSLSDDDGKFTISDAPRGALIIRGIPKDFSDSPYSLIMLPRTITGTGTIQLGDVGILQKRIKDTDVAGELGVNWGSNPDGTPMEKRVYKVAYIDPKGPASKTDLKIGDVLTSVDGIDITGDRVGLGWPLMRAAPGTALVLGVARGASVTVVLAAP